MTQLESIIYLQLLFMYLLPVAGVMAFYYREERRGGRGLTLPQPTPQPMTIHDDYWDRAA